MGAAVQFPGECLVPWRVVERVSLEVSRLDCQRWWRSRRVVSGEIVLARAAAGLRGARGAVLVIHTLSSSAAGACVSL